MLQSSHLTVHATGYHKFTYLIHGYQFAVPLFYANSKIFFLVSSKQIIDDTMYFLVAHHNSAERKMITTLESLIGCSSLFMRVVEELGFEYSCENSQGKYILVTAFVWLS